MLFADLLKVALGSRKELPRIPSEEEWMEIFQLSKAQTMLGITYKAIEVLPPNQRPPKPLILKWIAASERIKYLNEKLNAKAIEISRQFYNDGFRNITLKGQSVARYYKNKGLDLYRTPGDIDIWLDGEREEIISYVRRIMPDSQIFYHHMDYPKIDGIEIEVHFTPSWMNSYFTNQRLQQLFNNQREELFNKDYTYFSELPAPSLAFDRVYILIHIFRHLFHEGIGLRQLLDYYFVLCQGFTDEERESTMQTLRSLKMGRFTGATMWVLQEVFGLEEQYMLAAPNEKDGKFLLEEIMLAGNFGHYDKRIMRSANESNFKHGLRKVKHNFRFFHSYPSEVLWSPIFKLWHFFWRAKISKH